jgi:carbohydrate kinase of FGGY family protein
VSRWKSIRQILELFDRASGPAARVVAVGGGTQGGLWTQIVTDVTGREQLVPDQAIGASYGDALLAAIGVGLQPADTDWTVITQSLAPDPKNRAVYDELYGLYGQLYPGPERSCTGSHDCRNWQKIRVRRVVRADCPPAGQTRPRTVPRVGHASRSRRSHRGRRDRTVSRPAGPTPNEQAAARQAGAVCDQWMVYPPSMTMSAPSDARNSPVAAISSGWA